MKSLERLQEYIKKHALFQEKERVLLAVSGGRDSVLMAKMFKLSGYNFGIAHCNFQLRGKESDEDELFTANLAAELEVEFHVIKFNTQAFANQNHISIQMAARDLRYQWLEKIREEKKYQYIALAHHQNDVIETILLNLTRGTGIAGLHGILAKKGKIIRPLLFLSREEIDSLASFKFREDSSNLSTKYARNKIRLEVIPVLKQLNPSLEHTFEANRKRFEELEILLKQRVEELRTDLFKSLSEHEFEIDLEKLKKLIPLNTLLYELFNPYGFSEAILGDLSKSWNGNSGKLFRSATHELLLDRGRILLSRIHKNILKAIRIEHHIKEFNWNGRQFIICQSLAEKFELRNQSKLAQLDYDLLEFPLIMRNWQHGDFFYPLGLKTKKKLSDFFIEQKISLNHKDDIAVLENGNGDIIWIAGLRISDHYKISPNTKKVFILEQLK
jgi:tRNA(Ile)-lysidine synthase